MNQFYGSQRARQNTIIEAATFGSVSLLLLDLQGIDC
jgi:hypothetical protein